jgi:hypothetical protein
MPPKSVVPFRLREGLRDTGRAELVQLVERRVGEPPCAVISQAAKHFPEPLKLQHDRGTVRRCGVAGVFAWIALPQWKPSFA